MWSASIRVVDPEINPDVEYKSIPHPAQCPGSPSMPKLVNSSSTSLTISWDKPHRIGDSPLQGYQIDYWTSSTVSHWLTIYDVTQEIYTLNNLEPNTRVKVLIRAKNNHGLSPPSPVSKLMATLDSKHLLDSEDFDTKDKRLLRQKFGQRMVELVVAEAIGPKKIRLKWEVRFLE